MQIVIFALLIPLISCNLSSFHHANFVDMQLETFLDLIDMLNPNTRTLLKRFPFIHDILENASIYSLDLRLEEQIEMKNCQINLSSSFENGKNGGNVKLIPADAFTGLRQMQSSFHIWQKLNLTNEDLPWIRNLGIHFDSERDGLYLDDVIDKWYQLKPEFPGEVKIQFYYDRLPILVQLILVGDMEKASKLVSNGLDVDSSNTDGQTSLMYSVLTHQYEFQHYLLENGANVNKIDSFGNDALIYAVSKSDLKSIQLLLKHGAQVNCVNCKTVALIEASRLNDTEITSTLISKGADMDARDRHGMTALIHAATLSYQGILELLLNQHAQLDKRDNQGQTALIHAAIHGHYLITENLLNAGADCFILDSDGLSSFNYAWNYQRKDVLQILRSHDCIEDLTNLNTSNDDFFDSHSYLKYL